MAVPEPVVLVGELADHPAARALALEVRRIHDRYAREIVQGYGLCPFLRDADTAFGCFCVVLDREPSADSATRAVLEASSDVVHLVYPLIATPARAFERYATAFVRGLAAHMNRAPVHATFHPELSGERTTKSSLVGLVRRAPDPFVQLVPVGLQPGGTVFMAPHAPVLPPAHERGLDRLEPADVDVLIEKLAEIRADRNQSYAPLLAALA